MDDPDNKSKQSAKECRKRKKLRYQTLEAIAQREEAAINVLYRELEQMKLLFEQLDRGSKSVAEARSEVGQLRGIATSTDAKSPTTFASTTPTSQSRQRQRRMQTARRTRGGGAARRRFENSTDLAPIQMQVSPMEQQSPIDPQLVNQCSDHVHVALATEQYQEQHQPTLQTPTGCSAGVPTQYDLQLQHQQCSVQQLHIQQTQLLEVPDGIGSFADFKSYLINEQPQQMYPDMYQHDQHQVYAQTQDYLTRAHQPQLYQQEQHPSEFYGCQNHFWQDEAVEFQQQQHQHQQQQLQSAWCSVQSVTRSHEVAELSQLHGSSVAETLNYINNQASIA